MIYTVVFWFYYTYKCSRDNSLNFINNFTNNYEYKPGTILTSVL